jgi:DNA-binding IclR family transcriptional regulator
MMRKSPLLSSLSRAFDLLDSILADAGQSSLSEIARRIQLPIATAHRHAATLIEAGYLKNPSHGKYIAGPRLIRLARDLDPKQLIVGVAAPVVNRLAANARAIAQLGTLDSDMVTYRIKAGRGSAAFFTRVGMQLEAYCSGIGKVLLAHLPPDERKAYLSAGPFPALTERTITDSAALENVFCHIRAEGFAIDDGEIDDTVFCVAVPIRLPNGCVEAAVSLSQRREANNCEKMIAMSLPQLRAAAAEIERLLG